MTSYSEQNLNSMKKILDDTRKDNLSSNIIEMVTEVNFENIDKNEKEDKGLTDLVDIFKVNKIKEKRLWDMIKCLVIRGNLIFYRTKSNWIVR